MKSRKFSIAARLKSFKHASRGLAFLFREEHNSWIHLAIAVILIPVCILLHLSLQEWCLIVLCIGIVFALELINSAIERLADQVSPGHDKNIGIIKDMAAGAVLIGSIAAAATGLIILLPKFFLLIHP
ncbi:MAG: diacylglycerol kinase family protein [Bacteroidales bacterium]|jgi:diacylglycerol kinase